MEATGVYWKPVCWEGRHDAFVENGPTDGSRGTGSRQQRALVLSEGEPVSISAERTQAPAESVGFSSMTRRCSDREFLAPQVGRTCNLGLKRLSWLWSIESLFSTRCCRQPVNQTAEWIECDPTACGLVKGSWRLGLARPADSEVSGTMCDGWPETILVAYGV